MDIDKVVFVQQFRTPTSEIWLAETSRKDGESIAQIDIHYGTEVATVTVTFIVKPSTEHQVYRLLDLIDDELISMNEMEKGNIAFRVIYGGPNKTTLLKREIGAESGDDPLGDLLGGSNHGS
jgi:hypothetical protein